MSTNFGKETSCTTDLRTGRYVTGARLVAEAAYRRLTTPRGMLRGGEAEQDYGIDLTDLIGSASTKADSAALPGRITSELLKDERIVSVEVDVTRKAEGPAVAFVIDITAQTGEGEFTLQVGVAEVTVELLGITAEAA